MKATITNISSTGYVIPSFYEYLEAGASIDIYRSFAEFSLSLTSLKGYRFQRYLDTGKMTVVFAAEAGDTLVPVPDGGGGGGGGSVTNVSAFDAKITVFNGNTTPIIRVNTGTDGNSVAIGNDVRLNAAPSVAGQVPYALGVSGYAVAAPGSANEVLHGGAAPSFGPVDLANDVTGRVSLGNIDNTGVAGSVLSMVAGAPAWSSSAGTSGSNFTMQGRDVGLATVVAVTGASAGTTLSVNTPVLQLNVTGSVALTSTPHLQTSGITAGTRLTVVNTGTGSLTFSDVSVLAGSGVHLSSGYKMTLRSYESVDFIYAGGVWSERAVVANDFSTVGEMPAPDGPYPAIAAGTPVALVGGVIVPADATNSTAMPCVGIYTGSATNRIRTSGAFTGLPGLPNNAPLYIAVGGGFTDTAPALQGAISQRVGTSYGTTVAFVTLFTPVTV